MIDVLSKTHSPAQPATIVADARSHAPGDAMERWSLCAEFVSPDFEWFGDCPIVSGWKLAASRTRTMIAAT
jgi:hypothetical protein